MGSLTCLLMWDRRKEGWKDGGMVAQGCCNQCYKLDGLNSKMHCLTVLEAGSLESSAPEPCAL